MKKFSFVSILIALLSLVFSCQSIPSVEDLAEAYEPGLSENSDGWELIHYAAAYWDRIEISALIAADADIEKPDRRGNTPIAIAALFANRESFAALLEAGADPTRPNEIGGSALTYLGYFHPDDYEAVFATVDSSGYDIDSRDENGMALLHFAAYGSNVGMIASLLNYADYPAAPENLTGLTPWDFARLSDYVYTDLVNTDIRDDDRSEVLALLEQAGAAGEPVYPLSIAVVGNFFVNLANTINALFPFDLEMQYLNQPQYFRFWNQDGQDIATIDLANIEDMAYDFGFTVDVTVHSAEAEDLHERFREYESAEDVYFIWFRIGRHPYFSNFWIGASGILKEGNYRGYIVGISNPNQLMQSQYFRIEDVQEMVALRFEALEQK
jgi:hypothetical protein